MPHAHDRFLGCPIDALDHAAVMDRARAAIAHKTLLTIEGLNVAKLIQARRDPMLWQALDEASIVHMDGAGVAIGARLLGYRFPPRRAGIDLMLDLLRLTAEMNAGVFLLGATQDSLTRACENLKCIVAGLQIVGSRNGYFSADEEAGVAQQVRESGAALLLLGISSPKKEVFLNRYQSQMGIQVAMGVGGSFDVYAGIIKRAPRWMQRCGMEWVFRLIQEPKRLIWRYVDTNLSFAFLLLKARLFRGQV